MRTPERLTAFFGAMLLTFGISGLDMEEPSFSLNQKAYIAIALGLISLIAFFIIRRRNRT